ncbi:MAG: hypothetical protein HFI06_05575 [Eubacterium sp.]|jgi:HPt (histidine-containing phosphotransfer) domain-containing protein|nr:hypothetical protein [Eubacterium sp.]NBI86631.1 hypothetical protein [Lachnospiraceae bacterium]
MSVLEELRTLGVDIDDGLKRLNGNEKLYTRLLGKFVDSFLANQVSPDFDAADCQGTIEKAHSIKGTAGNLSLTPIFEAYSEILKLLRTDKPEEAREILKNTIPVQEQIIACIQKHME